MTILYIFMKFHDKPQGNCAPLKIKLFLFITPPRPQTTQKPAAPVRFNHRTGARDYSTASTLSLKTHLCYLLVLVNSVSAILVYYILLIQRFLFYVQSIAAANYIHRKVDLLLCSLTLFSSRFQKSITASIKKKNNNNDSSALMLFWLPNCIAVLKIHFGQSFKTLISLNNDVKIPKD